ncbi:HAD family hydrolase [Kitasatospora sp. McL0602]|uniref:HAD family hydrolase n=1 Tax=Kitasatospora sp. McL0602 TaxID=3439530 RepID=UPI003F8A874C
MSNVPSLPIEAVLFDLDGTLVDHDAAAEEAVAASFLSPFAPSSLERDRVVRRWRELEAWAMDRYLAGELTFHEQRRLRITRLADEFGLGAWSDEKADDWFAQYLSRYEAAWQTYNDVTPALAVLTAEPRQLRLGVITNGDADQQRRKLQHVGLTSLLQHATISSEAGAAKPDAKIFRTACSELQLQPSQVVYVGDRLQTDAEAAIAAGLHGIWLDRRDIASVTSVPRIRTLTELAPLLTQLMRGRFHLFHPHIGQFSESVGVVRKRRQVWLGYGGRTG